MNILIVSYESWRDTNNGGNVLSNIFAAFPDADIAQVYCCGEMPKNTICRKYFQISDTMLLTGQKGRKLEVKDYFQSNDETLAYTENVIKDRIPRLFKASALLAREVLWTVFDWRTKELENFVASFNPDVIFAPCYSYFHVSKLALHIKSIANCPMISYISDDNYSLKQLRFSPSFWINRLITRKWIRKHFNESSLIYTMTELQKKEYASLSRCPMKILCKSASFEARKGDPNSPVQLIYAGGLYLNRWKELVNLSKILKVLNADATKAQLHIFSNSTLSNRKRKKLNDGKNSFLHNAVPYSNLVEQYKKFDIALHVESFDVKNRLATRLSFSTKIIDCMNSGCAILAIGPSTQAGISYLKENDAAICVSNAKDLDPTIEKLISSPEIIKEYSQKAALLGEKNHNKFKIEKELRQDFCRIISHDY